MVTVCPLSGAGASASYLGKTVSEPTRSAAPRATGAEKRAALPRELADFLIEFSIALHKHAMYPGGHPTLAPAAEGVAARLGSLLGERGTLSLGVARDQLVIEGVATDPKNPVLHDLAERLHRHHLGAVQFSKGVSPAELEEALKVLALDSDRQGDPIGLRPAAEIPRWKGIQLYPVTFDRLELVGGPEASDAGEDGGGAAVTGGRGAQLWVGLARAAMAAGDQQRARPAPEVKPPEPHAFRLDKPAPPPPESAALSEGEVDAALSGTQAGETKHDAADPHDVAKAIESHERGTAYDQVIVGYMLQIADELKATGGAGAVALRKKMSRLVTSLDNSTLERLLDMGGDLDQRKQFLLDASQGMAAEAVVDLVRAASGTGAPISQSMLRMLQKMSQHAERGPAPRRTMADAELREQVAELVRGWGLADPNPDGYALALRKMAEAAPNLVAADDQAFGAEPERLVQMAIETGGTGVPVDRAVGELVVRGRIPQLLELLERAPRSNKATESIRGRIVDPGMLKVALSGPHADFDLCDRLIAALGARAAEPMLDVLADSESRQVRRALIDRLLKMPDAVRPLLAARAGDARWYVQRNILMLAADLPGMPLALDAVPFRQHADVRVRREALRVLFRHADERARALATALADEDPRIKRLALNALMEAPAPEPLVPSLVAIASDSEQESELRVQAIRALGVTGGRLALGGLLKLTEPRRRSIMDMLSAHAATPEYLAALSSLGPHRADARVRERLESAAQARDPAVVKAATDALRGG
jgi:hypothetical protein